MHMESSRGRVRGRLAGRSRAGPDPNEGETRRPGIKPPEHMPTSAGVGGGGGAGAVPKIQQERRPGGPGPSQPAKQLEPQRARGQATMPSRPVTQVVAGGDALVEQLSATHISEGGRTAGETSRGAITKRTLEEAIRTRPQSNVTKVGTLGAPIPLTANYFKLQTHTDWALYQYRVDFQPDEDRTIVRKALLKVHKDTLGGYMFDGTVLYTIDRLHPDPLELFSARKGDEQKVKVIIKRTADLAMGDPHYIQFFNLVVRKCLQSLNLQLVGRDYYDAEMKVVLNDYNFEVWPGIATSIRQHEQNILLNVDVTHKVMRQETALELLDEIRNRQGSDFRDMFEQAMIGSTVITRYNNKTYRVDDIDWESTPKSTFPKRDEQVAYMDYYLQRYQIKIRNVHQPLLVSRPKARDIRGGRVGNILLIPELCYLTGLTDSMRMNLQLMRALAELSMVKPSLRIVKYNQFMSRMNSKKAVSEELSLWNLKFVPTLVEFNGRVFPPETVLHGGRATSKPDRDADWTKNLRGKSMLVTGRFDRWAIIFPRRNGQEVGSFVRTLQNSASSLQFPIPEPLWEEIPDDKPTTYVHAIEQLVARKNPQLVMCIVPNNRAERYSAIKKKCCVDRAVPSQVVLAKNLSAKGLMSIATKIAIQMNCKIGGAPWGINIPFKVPVMIVGFDVYHDTLSKGRSFGAMVATLNSSYTRYFSAISPHSNREELSNDISIQIRKACIRFREINETLPSKIIIYRDGVGEGNINYVFQHEIGMIKAKLQKLYSEEPHLVFVIVSKRINTRLFFRGENPPPGTVADDVITQPDKYDFFLVSQSVKQGTVSPTSYNVIHDNSGLMPDNLQKLSYKLCHMYYNWSGTIRVPAPCQYAHKLAFLTGQYLHKRPNEGLDDLLYFL